MAAFLDNNDIEVAMSAAVEAMAQFPEGYEPNALVSYRKEVMIGDRKWVVRSKTTSTTMFIERVEIDNA